MKKIYFDNASTTPVDKKVLNEMAKYWSVNFANPSSIHSIGVTAKITLQKARKTIADLINGHDREIIFTSGGTEANNLAIFGIRGQDAEHMRIGRGKPHFITTEIEHSSVLECFKKLESDGCKVDYLKVDEFGLVNPKDLREIIKKETLLISIGYANGEIGVVQPIKEIAKEIRNKRREYNGNRFGQPYLHTDASAGGLYLNLNVEELGVDLMTLDAQKIYGPKGVGALFVRDGIKIEPMIFGGGQEKGIRSGTENVPLIVGFAKALEIARKMKDKESARLIKMRDEFFYKIKKFVPAVVINGHLEARLPNNINVSIPGQDGEMMVFRLDEAGMICSSSSACASGSGESVVVRKLALNSFLNKNESGEHFSKKNVLAEKTNESKGEIDLRAKSTLRFSMGRDTKLNDIKMLFKILSAIIKK